MAQTLASVVSAKIDDSHREYPGLLRQEIGASRAVLGHAALPLAAADRAQATSPRWIVLSATTSRR
jgi:hypothetical protein